MDVLYPFQGAKAFTNLISYMQPRDYFPMEDIPYGKSSKSRGGGRINDTKM